MSSAGKEISNPQVFLDISINGSPPERIVIELFANFVPKTAENFRALCVGNKGTGKTTGKPLHYKGCVFHTIYEGFVAQGGDFENQNGTGGESIYGGTFEDESYELKHGGPGILSMASAGPNLNGSRFFITFRRQRFLDGCHVVFGKVIKGMETVHNMERLGTQSGEPTGLVVITDCGELLQVRKDEPEANLQKDNDLKLKSKCSSSSEDEKANPTDFVNCNFGEIQTRALMRKYKEERMFDARHPSAGEEISNPQVFLDISINESPPERIVIELFANVVPKTAENFRALCVGNKGTGKTTGKPLHYKGCVFRRIIKGFFAEVGGDVENQNGTAGESIYGGTFEDESYELKHSGPGILSMASAGPNLNGSRFLICFSRQRSLDGCHVVFGKVIKGMETVQNIERLGTPSGEPTGLVVVTDCGEILQDKNKNVIESVKLPSSSVTKDEPEANLHKDNDSERSSKRKRSIFFGDEEANRPSSSVRKEEPIAKLQKDNDSKKFEPSDEKLEATLKNNVLVTSGNDREVTSEKLSSNPHQHSDDPSKSRYTEELARDHSPRLQRLEDLTQWQTRAMIDIAKAMKVKLAPLPPTGRRSS